VYEDNPWAYLRLPYRERFTATARRSRYMGWRMRNMHILPIMLIILFAGLELAETQFHQEAVYWSILGVTLFLMVAIGFALSPTKYQIFNEKIRIVLGYILHFDIPFSNIENVTAATFGDLWGLNLNFINSYSSDDILQIARKRGAKIHITPWNRKLFLENLDKALNDWRRYNIS
jgi:hypothetical protein